MKMDQRTMQQLAEAGFNAGWMAAMTRLADVAEKQGAREQAIALREWAKHPDRCETVEMRPGETSGQAIARAQRGGTPS